MEEKDNKDDKKGGIIFVEDGERIDMKGIGLYREYLRIWNEGKCPNDRRYICSKCGRVIKSGVGWRNHEGGCDGSGLMGHARQRRDYVKRVKREVLVEGVVCRWCGRGFGDLVKDSSDWGRYIAHVGWCEKNPKRVGRIVKMVRRNVRKNRRTKKYWRIAFKVGVYRARFRKSLRDYCERVGKGLINRNYRLESMVLKDMDELRELILNIESPREKVGESREEVNKVDIVSESLVEFKDEL